MCIKREYRQPARAGGVFIGDSLSRLPVAETKSFIRYTQFDPLSSYIDFNLNLLSTIAAITMENRIIETFPQEQLDREDLGGKTTLQQKLSYFAAKGVHLHRLGKQLAGQTPLLGRLALSQTSTPMSTMSSSKSVPASVRAVMAFTIASRGSPL